MFGKQDSGVPTDHNPFLERELIDAIRRNSFQDLEKIPELRNLISSLRKDHAERALLSESLNTLDMSDINKLFSDYMKEMFDHHLHMFFSKMTHVIMRLLRDTISKRLDVMEDGMADMKRSVLMAALHPYAWVESEIASTCVNYLAQQPGMRAGLHDIYRHIAYEASLPLPGANLTDKYQYILKVLRQVPDLREWEGMYFELEHTVVREERETFAQAVSYIEPVLMASLQRAASRRGARKRNNAKT